MRKYFLVAFFIIAFDPAIATAADYYYCDCQVGADSGCSAGNDANPGTSPDLPRQSFAHAQSIFANLDAGDTIRFCRGGSFSAGSGTSWLNTHCTAANPCTVTDYTPGWQTSPLPRPIIRQPNNATLFGLSNGGNASHQEGHTFANLDLRCPGCLADGTGWAFFLYNDIDDVIIENIAMDNFRIGVHLGGANLPAEPGSDGTLDRITLRKLTIVNGKAQGILGGANGLVIEDSYLENNGGGTFFDHNIYISKGRDIVVRRNELYRSSLDSDAACHGTSLVVHGIIDNLLIEANTVREDVGWATQYCWAIAVVPGYNTAEAFSNVTIRGNKIINVGNEAIAMASCRNCLIENNVILHQQPFGIVAINASDVEKRDGDANLDNVTIRNNSVYIDNPVNAVGIRLGREGAQHLLVSNAVQYTGHGTFTCLDADLPTTSYTAIDNNICYFPNADPGSEWEWGSGTTLSPLEAWQTHSDMGANSRYEAPGFLHPDLPEVNFTAVSGTASMVDNGHTTLSAPFDYRGKRRDARPDVGAFEYFNPSFNPPVAPVLHIE